MSIASIRELSHQDRPVIAPSASAIATATAKASASATATASATGYCF
eukprot:IDg21236t1